MSKLNKAQKTAKKIVTKIFKGATVEFGIHMNITEVGDPKLSQLYKLRNRLRDAGLLNKQQTVNFLCDEEGEFFLQCTISD